MYIHNAWGKMQQCGCDRWAVYYTVSDKNTRKESKKKTTFARRLLGKAGRICAAAATATTAATARQKNKFWLALCRRERSISNKHLPQP